MGYFILSHHLDLVVFAVLLLSVMAGARVWVKRTTGQSRPAPLAWLVLLAIIALSTALAQKLGKQEGDRQQQAISSLAPTYAEETARAGLASISRDTPPDDPVYLQLIADQIRWQKNNPLVADIYVIGRGAGGEFLLLVDSETDYDRSGRIDADREERTAIGEIYEEDREDLEAAMAGQFFFDPVPTTDRWGVWISAYAPVPGPGGAPMAVLGVDFDARDFVYAILWHRGAMLSLGCMVGLVFIGALSMIAVLRGELAKRQELQKQLVEASRRAGMADIATGVLHNVGNVLNSVNVSASMITDKVRAPEVAELAQAAGMLTGQGPDLARYLTEHETGRHVPAYVAELARVVQTQHMELDQEVARLRQGIEHIKEVVRSQQEHAKGAAAEMDGDPDEVLRRAVDMNFMGLAKQGVEVTRDIRVKGPLKFDQHKVLQILVNLVANAQQAMEESPVKRLTLSVWADPSGRMTWQVADTGQGIPPENLTRIFQHGFTTRTNGHGFGLHSCANAATELGGKLTVHSEGPGKGATFTLEIPSGTIRELHA